FALLLNKLFGYLRTSLSQGLIIQRLSEGLRLEARAVEEIITNQLTALGDNTKKAIADLLDPAYSASDSNVALTSASFPNQFNTVIRLQKVALLCARLSLTSDQVAWLRAYGSTVTPRQVPWVHAAQLAGWLRLDDLPAAETLSVSAQFYGLLRLVALTGLRDSLPHGAELLDGLF